MAVCAPKPGIFVPTLLRGGGPLDVGAEPVSGPVSLGVGAVMRTQEQRLVLAASLTQALEILV